MKKYLAFPRPASRGNNYLTGEEDVVVDPQQGMTLRDYFAAKAMVAFINKDEWQSTVGVISVNVAFNAYSLADAMLEEREK